MNIGTVSINRPVLASVISILIVLFGAIGFGFLGVREYPSCLLYTSPSPRD